MLRMFFGPRKLTREIIVEVCSGAPVKCNSPPPDGVLCVCKLTRDIPNAFAKQLIATGEAGDCGHEPDYNSGTVRWWERSYIPGDLALV